ncbi:MAG: metallophosphoesterase, partial [Candidatus Peribacteraceae bacterium]|nr:metallophosphoesterase [Candidatus Peribacteraceae bacterium]
LWMRIPVTFVGTVMMGFFLLIAYGSFVEPQRITVTRVSLPFPLSESIKIAIISDLHVGPYKGAGYIARVVRRINREMPDIVLIAGDMVLTDHMTPALLMELEPLKNLRPVLGTFVIMGNHDHGIYRLLSPHQHRAEDRSDLMAEKLKQLGLVVLENAQSELRIGDDTLRIAGIEEVLSGQADIEKTMHASDSDSPIILIAHNPDIILDPLSRQATLIVAGHTHGGQIRLPSYGPISALPTHIGRKYDQGIFHLDGGTTFAITRGVGESGPRARLFAPPEILMITTIPKQI